MTKQETLNSFLVALSSTCPTMNRRLCIRAAQSFWNGFSFNVQLDGLFIDVSESNVAMVNWSAWGAVSAERAGVFAAAVAQGVECAKQLPAVLAPFIAVRAALDDLELEEMMALLRVEYADAMAEAIAASKAQAR